MRQDRENSGELLEQAVVLALRQVYDPDIAVNVYDLGLIYSLDVNESSEVAIRMTLTSPTCPVADRIIDDVNRAVRETPGVTQVRIELVFEPEWDKSMISEEGLAELGLL